MEKAATGLEGEIAKIDTKISSVPVEVIDIEDVRSKIQNINNRVASLSENTSKLEAEKTSSEQSKGKIETFLEQFDIDQYFEKREQIQTLNREVSDIESELELIAQKASDSVGDFILNRFNELESGIRLGNLGTVNLEEKRLILDRLIGLEPSFRQLILLDNKGNILDKVSRLSSYSSSQISEFKAYDLFLESYKEDTK